MNNSQIIHIISPRTNFIMAEIVHFGTLLSLVKGAKNAAEYLHSHNVPLEVAIRVLFTEERRMR